jgi:hypothetical protein
VGVGGCAAPGAWWRDCGCFGGSVGGEHGCLVGEASLFVSQGDFENDCMRGDMYALPCRMNGGVGVSDTGGVRKHISSHCMFDHGNQFTVSA